MRSLRSLIDLFDSQQSMKPAHVSGTPHPSKAVAALERALRVRHSQGLKFNYDIIDQIMQKVCRRYNVTGDQLHDLFVSKHRMVPDAWVKTASFKNFPP